MEQYNFKRVVILGAAGMLGRYAHRYFQNKYSVYPVTRDLFDFSSSLGNCIAFLRDTIRQDDLVINCIGMINKRKLETKEDELDFFHINSVLPRLIAIACSENGARLAHPTTDCVYTGNKGNYSPDSLPDSIDTYGLSKSLGDGALHGFDCAAVFRVSIIGEESNSRSLVEWLLSVPGDQKISGYTNHLWNGITCLQLIREIEDHALYSSSNMWGGLHVLATEKIDDNTPGPVTKLGLVKMISTVYGLDLNIDPLETPAPNFRDLNPGGNDKNHWYVKPTLRQQIQEMYDFDVLDRRI